MTDPVEGNPTEPGEVEETSPASDGTSQPLPEYVTAILTKLGEQDKLIRGLQKGTDKQIGQLKSEYKSEIKRILELKEKGLDEDQIQRELWIDSQMTPSAPAGQNSESLDINAIDRVLELPNDDPRVTNLKLLYGHDKAKYLEQGLKLKSSLPGASATPGEQPLPSGSPPLRPQPVSVEKLTEQYKTDMYAARGNKALLRQIKDKAIGLGVPVDTVTFS